MTFILMRRQNIDGLNNIGVSAKANGETYTDGKGVSDMKNFVFTRESQLSNFSLTMIFVEKPSFMTKTFLEQLKDLGYTKLTYSIARVSHEQEVVVDACIKYDYERVFEAFVNDPLVSLPLDKAKALFIEMVENTKKFIPRADEFLAKF